MEESKDKYLDTAVFYDPTKVQAQKSPIHSQTPLGVALTKLTNKDKGAILALFTADEKVVQVRNFYNCSVKDLYYFFDTNDIDTGLPIRALVDTYFGQGIETQLGTDTENRPLNQFTGSSAKVFNSSIVLSSCSELIAAQEKKLVQRGYLAPGEYKLEAPGKKPKSRKPVTRDPQTGSSNDLDDSLASVEQELKTNQQRGGQVSSAPVINLDDVEDIFQYESKIPSASVADNAIETLIEDKQKEEKVMPSSEEESEMVNTETYSASFDQKPPTLFAKLSMLQKDLGMEYAEQFIPSEIDLATVEAMIKQIRSFVDKNNNIGKRNIRGAAMSLLASSENEFEQVIAEMEEEFKAKGASLTEANAIRYTIDRILTTTSRKLGQLSGRVRPADDPSGGFRGDDPSGGFRGGRHRTDFEVAIKSQMQPMESYVWTDLGWINPALSWFHGKTNGQMAVRQGDLVFRPRGKESSHVLDTGHTTHFLGIALTSKGLMFAGQKINFPVALGGGMTTYNRSRAPLTPFATLNATMQSKCIEVLEGHNRSVGSLAHTERGPIVSLGWSVRGGPADVIVSY